MCAGATKELAVKFSGFSKYSNGLNKYRNEKII